MDISIWQIWLLLGVCITGSLGTIGILFIYCCIKFKRSKIIKKEIDEVIVVQDKNGVTDKDQNDNVITEATENSFSGVLADRSIGSFSSHKERNKLSSTVPYKAIEKTVNKDWYHSCPDLGRSTITRSENGYIIIAQSRPIVVDGNDVGVIYGNGSFSAKGLAIIHRYFTSRGWTNKEIFIFVKPPINISIEDQNICKQLENLGVLSFTRPTIKSRPVSVTSEEHYKILEYAKMKGGIIVTKNSFHDWYDCCPEFREVISKRLLKYSFVKGDIVFHTKAIQKDGKTLEEFLTF